MNVDGNLRLLCIAAWCDWLMQLVSFTEPLKGKRKTNRDLLARVPLPPSPA